MRVARSNRVSLVILQVFVCLLIFGKMRERSIRTVSKTVIPFFGIGGSNPPLSAFSKTNVFVRSFDAAVSVFLRYETTKKIL